MNTRALCVTLALASAWVASASSGAAAAPWDQLLTVHRVEADPDASYALTEDNGPWMIVACSFSGNGSEEQARGLVLELRKRYKLPAYMHKKQFEFGDAQGRGVDRYGAPVRMRHRRDKLEEVAVLVGNYSAVDDPEAQRVLNKLKYSRPKSLELKEGEATHQTLAGWRLTQKKVQEFIGSEEKEKGPMGHAFVTTNPLLPAEYFAPKGVDKLVLRMNKDVEYSLLDCPGKYTIQVATFKGSVVIKQDEIHAIENGKPMKSKLDEAAAKADQLTKALRVKGWEAYQFHDRYASIVTVGGFESVGTSGAGAQINLHPEIYTIMRTFAAEPAAAGAGVRPKSLVGIPFDIQPIPVEVPKRSLSRELANNVSE